MNKRRNVARLILLTASIMFFLTACGSNNTPDESSDTSATNADALQVYFLDVGKGDATLIGIPGGYWVMIDTGPEDGFQEIGRMLMKSGITRLSAIFITHGHKDHIGGLEGVLTLADCDVIYTIPDCMEEKAILSAEQDRGVESKSLTADQSVQIGDAVLTVLGPVGNYDDENDASMVLMLEAAGTRMLFAADQLFQAEGDLLESGKTLSADVLKVAHHGQDDSTSSAFVKAVRPRFAVVPTSLSELPAAQVLNAVSKTGATAFVLGETGTLFYNGDSMQKTSKSDEAIQDVYISEKDISAEFVTVVNRSAKPLDLTGWCLFSKKGSDTYFFPRATELPPNGSVTVYSGKAVKDNENGLIWSEKNIWSNKKDDTCVLIDSYGRPVSSF